MPWANGAMCACFRWRSDAQTNMHEAVQREVLGNLLGHFAVGMVINYHCFKSPSMSKRTYVKPNSFRSRDRKHHIDLIGNRMGRSS